MRCIAAIPFLFVVLIASSCGMSTHRQAVSQDTHELSPAQARELLIKAVHVDVWCSEPKTVSVTYEKIALTCARDLANRPKSFRIAAKPALAIKLDSDLFIPMACVSAGERDGGISAANCMFYWRGGSAAATARDFIRAWDVLAAAIDPEKEAVFEQAADDYRANAVKPNLPEAAVKFKVQAELAVQQKRFYDAVDLYDQALSLAPWWPAGHYNRGLILGELEDYQGGIRSLQKYLRLEPEASNARSVQLKIYQWESLLPRAAN